MLKFRNRGGIDLEKYNVFFDGKGAKYIQIYNLIKKLIFEKKILPNEKLPSIRKLSSFLGVNSITIVKAYELLESEGYIYKKSGSGSFVREQKNNYGKIKIENHSNVYRLDTGNPSSDMFPIKDFKDAINIALDEDSEDIFDYDGGNGVPNLKKAMVNYLSELGIKSSSDNLLIISGAQQGIDIVCKTLVDYSDVVFIEEPTYYGALGVLKSRNAKLVSIPMLNDGIDIGILKLKLERIRPKMLYVMPNFQNPTGISYSETKKKKLIELAEEYDFYILEDDFISDFKFQSNNNQTLKSYDIYDRVIYIKSFSKILMPGLRVGVLYIPPELVNRALLSKYSSDISTSTLIQKSLFYYMDRFEWKEHMKIVGDIYTEKFIFTKKYLKEKLDGKLKLIETAGGINFFLELRRGFFSSDFVNFILDKGVAVQPGSIYYDNDIDDRFFRINIARENIDRIKEAIDIISDNIDTFYEKFSEIHSLNNDKLK